MQIPAKMSGMTKRAIEWNRMVDYLRSIKPAVGDGTATIHTPHGTIRTPGRQKQQGAVAIDRRILFRITDIIVGYRYFTATGLLGNFDYFEAEEVISQENTSKGASISYGDVVSIAIGDGLISDSFSVGDYIQAIPCSNLIDWDENYDRIKWKQIPPERPKAGSFTVSSTSSAGHVAGGSSLSYLICSGPTECIVDTLGGTYYATVSGQAVNVLPAIGKVAADYSGSQVITCVYSQTGFNGWDADDKVIKWRAIDA